MKDGPIKKFRLIKEHGAALRAAGVDPKTLTCKEIEAAIAAQTASEPKHVSYRNPRRFSSDWKRD